MQNNLIAKYLDIIKEQDELLKELSASNMKLLKAKNEAVTQKRIYKESAKEWKDKHDTIKECLQDTYNALVAQSTRCTNAYEANALKAYQENQRG
jgi:hypothetical protein